MLPLLQLALVLRIRDTLISAVSIYDTGLPKRQEAAVFSEQTVRSPVINTIFDPQLAIQGKSLIVGSIPN